MLCSAHAPGPDTRRARPTLPKRGDTNGHVIKRVKDDTQNPVEIRTEDPGLTLHLPNSAADGPGRGSGTHPGRVSAGIVPRISFPRLP